MTQGGMRRTNKNYGDSPGRRGSLPIASSLFESCSRIPTLPTRNRLASSTRGTVLRLPLRVDSGVLASPAKRVPRDPAPTLCRALMMQAVQTALGARDPRATQNNAANRRSREETPQVPRRMLLGRSAEKAQPARQARHDGSAGSWVAGSASLPPHLTHADHALE